LIESALKSDFDGEDCRGRLRAQCGQQATGSAPLRDIGLGVHSALGSAPWHPPGLQTGLRDGTAGIKKLLDLLF
jgi:hypothetical protein